MAEMDKVTLGEFLSQFEGSPEGISREDFLKYEIKFGHPWDSESSDVTGDMDFLDVTYDPEEKQVIVSITREAFEGSVEKDPSDVTGDHALNLADPNSP